MVNVLRRRSLFIEEVIVKIKFYSLNESDLFKNNIKILEFPTHELQRIGSKGGSPALHTGLMFIKLYLRECFLSIKKIKFN